MPSSIRKVNSSAVDSMKQNIKQVLRTSVKKIQGEMEEYSLYKHNYEFMMYSPIVQQLKQELALLNEEMNDLRNANKQLKRELKKVAKCESRIKKEKHSKKSNNDEYCQTYDESKEELNETPLKEDETMDEVEIVEVSTGKIVNIVYTIEPETVGESCEEEVEADEVDELGEVESVEEVEVETDEVETDNVETDEVDAEEVEVDEVETDEVEAVEEVETEEVESEEVESEEVEAEEVEVDEVESDEVEAEEVEVDEVEEEEVEEDEVYEIKIKGKSYYTTNEKSGTIYELDENGDVGDEIGRFVNSVPTFDK